MLIQIEVQRLLSNVNTAENIINCLKDDAEIDFRAFVRENSSTKWIIAADFVLTGDERINDAFAFTIFPYDADINSMMREINGICRNDIKNLKVVSNKMISELDTQGMT